MRWKPHAADSLLFRCGAWQVAGMSTEEHQALFGQCNDLMRLITEMPKPVIASVQGMATAAGCQLVAACDLAVCSEQSQYATPGVHIGLFCSTPAVAIGRSIGRKHAMQMLVTGEPISASTALSWGLVNKVVPDAEEDKLLRGEASPDSALYQETMSLAQTIAGHPTATIGHGKGVFYRQLEASSLQQAYGMAGKAMVEGMQKPDAQEGVAAFLGKRKPVWPSNL
jgi:enoyl-CoA hydratase/carnithine racemase